MTPQPEKDCTTRGWIALTALIAVLSLVSLIPPQRICGVSLRRANIFSDLIRFEQDAVADPTADAPLFDESDFRIDLAQVAELVADTLPAGVPITYRWDVEPAGSLPSGTFGHDTARMHAVTVPIEDFDTTGQSPLRAFYGKLAAGEPVRIAVLGDSFIEGDILTADLREKLQSAYGGSGTGFAPMASPLTGFRRTVRTQSRGWTAYNIMQRRNAPAACRDRFFVSGWVCRPGNGASVKWAGTDAKKHLDTCHRARILFTSRTDSRVAVTVNGSERREFAVAGDEAVREIDVQGRVGSLALEVLAGADGFYGYGAWFEDTGGVRVDNFSVRSNNGQALFWTAPGVNAQVNTLLGYDLVILQYGLNLLQSGIHAYDGYGRQVENMIAYVRQCFPTAAVLVMSVSDRSERTDQGFVPMSSAPSMAQAQRLAARRAGAAFWSTYEAMRSLGGMERFVRSGWAGKDYTHINYAGGQRIAWSLYDAITREVAACAAAAKPVASDDPVIEETLAARVDSLLYAVPPVRLSTHR